MEETVYCPNCGRRGHREGLNRIVCEACDAVFKVTEQGASVVTLGPLEEIKQRLAAVEQKIGRPAATPSAIEGESAEAGAEVDEEVEAADEQDEPGGDL